MSFENDITAVKTMVEAKPLFKPANADVIANREDAVRTNVASLVKAAIAKLKRKEDIEGQVEGECPVCGSDDLHWGDDETEEDHEYSEFDCNNCNASGEMVFVKKFSHSVVDNFWDDATGGQVI